MGVDHCGRDIAVSEKLLHGGDVLSSFEQMSGEGVTGSVAGYTLRDARRARAAS